MARKLIGVVEQESNTVQQDYYKLHLVHFHTQPITYISIQVNSNKSSQDLKISKGNHTYNITSFSLTLMKIH